MLYTELKFPKDSLFLVTGGAGFIGSNICEAILKMGYKVRCLDDLSTGKQANVDLLAGNPNYEFIKGDIKDLDTCMKACEGVDYVMNEAAWGSVPRSIEMPLFYCANNIQGTLNMMEAARQNGVKTFVYASSSSVYGDEAHLPKQEGVEGNLLSPYALTKRCDEEWAKQYTKHYGLKTIGLRYFNVFGRRQDPNGAYAAVIPLWVKALIRHDSPFINGDGSYSRDFTYVDNVIQANELAAVTPSEVIRERASLYNMTLPKNAPIDMVFNVAYGGNTTLNELFDCLRTNLSHYDAYIANIKPCYRDNRPGDIPHSQASIIKAQRVLGYQPKYNALSGFEQACEWYWRNLK